MNQIMNDVFSKYELPFETYFVKDVHHENQIHDEIELIWMIKGNGIIESQGKTYHLSTQTLYMVNVNELHSIRTSKDSLVIVYRFKNEHLRKNNLSFDNFLFDSRIYTFQELVIKYKEVPLLISQLLKLLVHPTEDAVIRYKIIGFYNMFVYELYTMLMKEKYLDVKKKNCDQYLLRITMICDYIHKNFTNKITLDEIANLVKLSRYRLSHFVKEYLGISLQEYINNLRLEKALRLLSYSEDNIISISNTCGFSDVKYLNKSIKAKLGLTALKYRKMAHHNQQILHIVNEDNIRIFASELMQCLQNIKQEYLKESKYS
jgi:AraC-like DNA-binding protein